MCPDKDVHGYQSLLSYAAVTKIPKSYRNESFNLAHVESCMVATLVLLHVPSHSGTCPEREQPVAGILCSLGKGKRTRGRAKPCDCP